MKQIKVILLGWAFVAHVCTLQAQGLSMSLSLKTPGNPSETRQLLQQGQSWTTGGPLDVVSTTTNDGDDELLTITLSAREKVYFHLDLSLNTELSSGEAEFYMPGFWYHRNMRSPQEAPSFKTSKHWNFREDRMSTPLTSAFNPRNRQGVSVLRVLDEPCDVQVQLTTGEIILPGRTSVGYAGFDGEGNTVALKFGYPYKETPKRYIRKLTLIDPITAFAKLEKGEQQTLRWRIHRYKANDFGNFVTQVWQYSYDRMQPQPLKSAYTGAEVKTALSDYFRHSFVDRYPLKYNSGLSLRVNDCLPATEMQIGFCGRVLLNAFNEIEYGSEIKDDGLVNMGQAIFDSFLSNGFGNGGYLHDFVNFRDGFTQEDVHSIRQQSEAVYAVLHYLKYEKSRGRRHVEWERRIRTILDNFVTLIKDDGHFARKFKSDGTDVDASGGSTPSATSALVMGWKYFGNKNYLQAARRTVNYLEKNIISQSDYFSSTLDANCEDKEAAIAAVTATYYMTMVTKGEERKHYIDLCKKAAYFAISWYYTWDVPFAPGQMTGELGLKTRGWGNVSVENNHIDVFVFELPHILSWLAQQTGEQRFKGMYDVITSSLSQLLPVANNLCGVGKQGFYPEVVQHTTWDYGHNGKGFYNDIFAPGWTIASLWELYSPNRTTNFLK